jgi:putative ATP-binding cassette transporter
LPRPSRRGLLAVAKQMDLRWIVHMSLVQMLNRGTGASRRRLLAMAALAGIANAIALGIINTAAQSASHGDTHLSAAVGLAAAIVAYLVAQRHIMRVCADEVEAMIARTRLQLFEQVIRADLRPMERLATAEVYAAITGDTLTISQAANMLVVGFQAAFVAAFVLAYVGFLSLLALLLSIALIALVSYLHLRRLHRLGDVFMTSMQTDTLLFDALDDAISGIKEIRMDLELRGAIAAEVGTRSLDTMRARIEVQSGIAREFVFVQILFFLLLGTIVFVVPDYSPGHPEVTTKVATAMLFVAGSLSILLQTIPAYARASAAANRIDAISKRIALAIPPPTTPSAADFESFQAIRLDAATFAYEAAGDEAGFTVGPIDLRIQRGEVVFLVGGNGSGKSTLLKLLVGLYRPGAGQILVDDAPVGRDAEAAYRALFAIILADFHLFDRLYGIAPDLPRLVAGLKTMGLSGKTRLEDGRFVTVALSAGQRKRLALLVAEQEARPVLVLDEWAAEQDPSFRRFFYQDLIPVFRERKVTVIAATHDDQYFAAADRVLRMAGGRLEMIS